MKDVLISALCAALLFFGVYFVGKRFQAQGDPAETIVTNTVVKIDTVFINMPEPYYITRTTTDTIKVAVTEYREVRDTVYLPREEVVYKDSTFAAQVSGVQPRLDWIEIYPKTVTVQTISVASRKRWGIGVQAGVGASVHGGQFYLSPYIGVGVSYDLFQW